MQAHAITLIHVWWQVVLFTLFLVALTGGLLVYYLRHRNLNVTNYPVPNIDQSKSVALQIGEARAMLAAGNVAGAIERLHSIVGVDPSNVEAHRLLGAALLRNGSRRQAVDEYFFAAQKDPKDAETLHALASLQFQEQLYADAVDSYRRLMSALGGSKLAPQDQLDYADALRIAGYTEDARIEYQRIIANGPADLVIKAKKHLAQLPPQTAANAQLNARGPSTDAATRVNGSATSKSSPTPLVQNPTAAPAAPAPRQADPDGDYSLGVTIVGGRDPKNIPRPELLHALELMQRAARGGQHRDQARKLAERLGREFDRRKSQGIQ